MKPLRILVANEYGDKRGGVETYLEEALAQLAARGFPVAYAHEDESRREPQLRLPPEAATFSLALSSRRASLDARAKWRPDVAYVNSFRSVAVLAELYALAPLAFSAHAYFTCVSGTKAFRRPSQTPCNRRLGPGCLLRYHARGCGGIHPITMGRSYVRRSKDLQALREHVDLLIVHSDHMRREYLRHGFSASRTRLARIALARLPASAHAASAPVGPAAQLLFVGRMERTKGGHVLLDALPQVPASLGRPIHLRVVGDGTARSRWEAKARQWTSLDPALRVEFLGWKTSEEIHRVFEATHLLVVPSVWPEPFGLVGLEAARFGVPAAAFPFGGIPEWLHDGVNGHLAEGDAASAGSLAAAIVRCLSDEPHYQALRRGAVERVAEYERADHIGALLELLRETVTARGARTT